MAKILKFAQPLYQLILCVLTILFIRSSINILLTRFNSTDEMPRIERLESDDRGFLAKNIKCGFFLKNFLDFNPVANKFIAIGSIWFEYLPELAHDLDKFSLGEGSIISKSDPLLLVVDGLNIVKYEIKIEFLSNLTYKYFPLEDHLIYFTISNQYLADKGFALQSSNQFFKISRDMNVDGWDLSSHRVISGYEDIQLGDGSFLNNSVLFLMDFMQTSNRSFLLLIMPLLICLFISLFSFSFKPGMLDLTTGNLLLCSITAMIAYRYVIESSSPKVSYYIFSDIFFYHILFFICIAFFINSFYQEKIYPMLDWVVFGLYLLFASSWYLILKWWFKL
jgi:hypothetical protein